MKDASEYRSEEEKKKEEAKQKNKEKQEGEKERVLHSEIVAPVFTPSEFTERKSLWEKVEKKEIRKDAQLAREIIVALPKELDTKTHIKITKQFCKESLVKKGMICDFSVHNQKNNNGNYHSHILCTLRKVEKKEFGNKERSWNDRSLVKEWQQNWQKIVNKELKKKDIAIISHKIKEPKARNHLGKHKHYLFQQASQKIKKENIHFKFTADNEVKASLAIPVIKSEKIKDLFLQLQQKYIPSWIYDYITKQKEELKKKKIAEEQKKKIDILKKIKEEAKRILVDNIKKNTFIVGKNSIEYEETIQKKEVAKYIEKVGKNGILEMLKEIKKEQPKLSQKTAKIIDLIGKQTQSKRLKR